MKTAMMAAVLMMLDDDTSFMFQCCLGEGGEGRGRKGADSGAEWGNWTGRWTERVPIKAWK